MSIIQQRIYLKFTVTRRQLILCKFTKCHNKLPNNKSHNRRYCSNSCKQKAYRKSHAALSSAINNKAESLSNCVMELINKHDIRKELTAYMLQLSSNSLTAYFNDKKPMPCSLSLSIIAIILLLELAPQDEIEEIKIRLNYVIKHSPT